MTVLILGGRGMLGHKLWQVCRDRFDCWGAVRAGVAPGPQHAAFPPSRTLSLVDAARFETVAAIVESTRPQVVVNAIGVVKQIETASDPVRSIHINALFPHQLAGLAASCGARLIHVSTDCVFSGRTGRYTEGDLSDADDLYGRSKRLGEAAGPGALTIRTSMIGRELQGAHGLVEWFLGHRGGRVRGFSRAFFSGLTTLALAGTIVRIIEEHPHLTGVYHVAGERISKFDLLTLVNEAYAAGVAIDEDDSFAIDRSLNDDRFRTATGWAAPSWREMVARMASDSTPYEHWRQT